MGIDGRRIIQGNLKNISLLLVIFVVIVGCVSICLDVYGSLQWVGENMCVTYYYYNASCFGTMYMYVLPVLAITPFTVLQCSEMDSKMYSYLIPKIGIKKYSFYKILQSGVVAGMVLLFTVLLFISVLAIKMPLINDEMILEFVTNEFIDVDYFKNNSIYKFYSFVVIRSFLFGFFWGNVTLLLSGYRKSVEVVIVSPYIFGFAISRIARLLNLPVWANLNYLFTGRYSWKHNNIYVLETVFVVAVTFVLTNILYQKKIGENLTYV